MQFLKTSLIVTHLVMCAPLFGQTPTFDEITFEDEEITMPYKNKAKNYVYLRSKRGTNGMNTTSAGDSIKSMPVSEIVLVYSEFREGAADEREEANRERWENLITTYPQYFQTNTSYKNVCQCNATGDTSAFKKLQGFYIYYVGAEPKAPEVKTVKTEEKKAPEKEIKEIKETDKPVSKVKEPEVKENNTVRETPPAAPAVKETHEESSNTTNHDVAKDNSNKKAPVAKPRRAKDTKACRLPCYENGDEDLNAFFRTSIQLTKKQKKHNKHLEATIKLPLHFDGSIKKPMVVGENEDLNKQITEALKSMNNWNAAVKNGVCVKSEVKITLKYDKETKSMKPSEVAITPKLGPKCTCVSDSEMFGE